MPETIYLVIFGIIWSPLVHTSSHISLFLRINNPGLLELTLYPHYLACNF